MDDFGFNTVQGHNRPLSGISGRGVHFLGEESYDNIFKSSPALWRTGTVAFGILLNTGDVVSITADASALERAVSHAGTCVCNEFLQALPAVLFEHLVSWGVLSRGRQLGLKVVVVSVIQQSDEPT